MRLLLDTQVVLWQIREPERLGSSARRTIGEASEVRISVVSFIEVGIKAAIGKLTVDPELTETTQGRHVLDLTPEHGLALAELPRHHGDPFDRLMIVQARAAGLTIVTSDPQFARYDVPVIDATA